MRISIVCIAALGVAVCAAHYAPPTAPTPAHIHHMKRLARHHVLHRRENLLLDGADFLSSLVGGEFTSLPINRPAPERSNAGVGGEFTSMRDTQPGDSDHSTRTHTARSSEMEGGANSRRSTSFDAESTQTRRGDSASSTQRSTSQQTSSTEETTSSSTRSSTSSMRHDTSTSRATPTLEPSSTGAVATVTRSDSPISVVDSSVTEPPPPNPQEANADKQDNGTDHTGLIVGVCVGGGVVLLALILFILFKVFGWDIKRMFHKNDEIRWPEIQQESTAPAIAPLPARRTGGAGFEMGRNSDEDDAMSPFHDQHAPMPDHSIKAASSFNNGSMYNVPATTMALQPVSYPAPSEYARNGAPVTHDEGGYNVAGMGSGTGVFSANHDPSRQQTTSALVPAPVSLGAPHTLTDDAEYGQYHVPALDAESRDLYSSGMSPYDADAYHYGP